MSGNTTEKANARRFPVTSTPENLEMSFSTVLNFGSSVLVAGYSYKPHGGCYYGAVYRFTTDARTCEDEVKLITASEETFEDNGHAIAWCMANCRA